MNRTLTPVTHRRRAIAVALTAVMVMTGLAVVAPSPANALTYKHCNAAKGQAAVASNYDFEETWARLTGALDSNPNLRTIKVIDHAAAALGAGLELEPNRIVVFGNPAIGSPLMAANRTVGVDLPQKMQVWQTGYRVCVGYNRADYLGARHALGDLAQLDTITGALAGLAEAASGNQPWTNPSGLSRVARQDGLTTKASDADFEATWQRLIDAIEASPANVAFTVDHGENSAGVLPPTRLVVFGNPNVGTPIMQARPTAGIDLPLKILVWEDENGAVQVTTNDADYLRWRHRLPKGTDLLNPVTNATTNFVTAAIGNGVPDPVVAKEPVHQMGRYSRYSSHAGYYFSPFWWMRSRVIMKLGWFRYRGYSHRY